MSDPTPTESLIVVGVMSPMTSKNMRIGGRSAASAGGKGVVDLAYARDLASRRCGPAAEAAIGRALIDLAAKGGDVGALAKSMGELLALAEGVVSGKPTAIAVTAANRLLTPESVLSSQYQEGAMDLIVLAYATLHYDEVRVLNGGVQ